jgi:hypothetical protein
MKLTTIALASAFALSGSFGFAHTIPHRPDVRTHTAYSSAAPSYGNSNGNLGGYGSRDVWGRFGSYYGPMIPSGGGGR